MKSTGFSTCTFSCHSSSFMVLPLISYASASCMVDSGIELEDAIDVEEKFRVLGFCLKTMNFSQGFSMKIASVGYEVSSVCFLSKCF